MPPNNALRFSHLLRGFVWTAVSCAVIATAGCQSSGNTPSSAPAEVKGGSPTTPVTPTTNTSTTPKETSAKPIERPKFDGDKAFAHLKKQCDFGPRIVGTPQHEKCRAYLMAELKKYADKVETQDFKYRGLSVSNVVGVFYAEGAKEASKNPVVLLAHWDTRPVADGPGSSALNDGPAFRFGAKGWNRLAPIAGASDGASGVAVLLELARVFKEKRPPVGVLLLMVDGEDYGDFRGGNGQGEGVLLGSRYFAKHYQENPAFGKPTFGILLDMVGGKNLILPREQNSDQYARGTNEKVFGIAQSLGYGETFLYDKMQDVIDDHMPLNEAGIPTIDLIHPLPFGEYSDQGYGPWHTLKDTPENCSAKSLKIVGETVAEVIYRESPGP